MKVNFLQWILAFQIIYAQKAQTQTCFEENLSSEKCKDLQEMNEEQYLNDHIILADTQKPNFTLEKSQKAKIEFPQPPQCDITIDQLRIWSKFDNGNLENVYLENDTYVLKIAKDLEGRKLFDQFPRRIWFYFKVMNKASLTREIKFKIENSCPKRFVDLWKFNPLIYTKIENEWKGLPLTINKQNLNYNNLKLDFSGKNIQAYFQFHLPVGKEVSFAFSAPWSYEDNQKYIDEIQEKSKKSSIYFQRELLCYSIEGRKIELITLTGKNKMLNEVEDFYGHKQTLFPHRNKQRPNKFDKTYIYITCRVHPSEAPASYMMQGLLDFLTSDNENAKIFRENFVLVLIPMLNPDGVYRGHYRLDALGYDLNRVYNRKFKANKFPQIYGNLQTAKYYDKNHKVLIYIDLHAHTVENNSFVLARKSLDDEQSIQTMLLPHILGQYLEFFKFSYDHFNLRNSYTIKEQLEGQYCENKNTQEENIDWEESKLDIKKKIMEQEQQERQNEKMEKNKKYSVYKYIPYFTGIGKDDIFFSTSITSCYTLEVNFKYFFVQENEEDVIKKFETSQFNQIGQAIPLAILEINQLIKQSHLKQPLDQIKEQIRNDLQNQKLEQQ